MNVTEIQYATLRAIRGQAVEIRRGAQLMELTIVPAESESTIAGRNGSYTEVTIADWLILVSEWTIQGPAEPQKGDEITIAGTDYQYLVAHPDATKPAFVNFNQLDRPAIAWRVHSVPK